MGEADVILGIKIKHENKGIVITQSHYIEKILKKFNQEDCSPVSTPIDPVEKHKSNAGKPMDQLEYSRVIGCLVYAMKSTRPDIAYAIGRLSRFTSYPSRQHWHSITRASKKQTCITGSTIESEFVALAAAGTRLKGPPMYSNGLTGSIVTTPRFLNFSVTDGHLGNDDLLETNEVSCSARIRVKEMWSANSLS
ncbi:hypothetical protein Tco_0278422 [Tanacetum coccineum]